MESNAVELRPLAQADAAFLSGLQHEMNTQPTLATADPRFWVIVDYEYYPAADCDHIDRITMFEGSCTVDYFDVNGICEAAYADALELGGEEYADEWLDEYELHVEEVDGTRIVKFDIPSALVDEYDFKPICDYYASSRGYTCGFETKRRRFVDGTMFLTLREAEEHLRRNRHHYDEEAYPYCMHAYRSPQVEQLYRILHEVDFGQLLAVRRTCRMSCDGKGIGLKGYTCSGCGEKSVAAARPNFCPSCGAEVNGDE